MVVRSKTARQGIEAWESPQLCLLTSKEAEQWMVLITTFYNCPVFPDPSQRVEEIMRVGVGTFLLGCQPRHKHTYNGIPLFSSVIEVVFGQVRKHSQL